MGVDEAERQTSSWWWGASANAVGLIAFLPSPPKLEYREPQWPGRRLLHPSDICLI